MTPAPLEAQFFRSRVAVEVTLHQPLTCNLVNVITDRLVGTMMARGKVHHYRVAVGEGLIYVAPPSWLVGDTPDRQEKGAALDALIARHVQEIIAAHRALNATTPEGAARPLQRSMRPIRRSPPSRRSPTPLMPSAAATNRLPLVWCAGWGCSS